MIITLTGPSGSGKTTIAKALIARGHNVRMLTSPTTRAPRATDIKNEYEYVSEAAFHRLLGQDAFLWTAEITGVWHGTTELSLHRALTDDNTTWIMILVPDVLPKLYAFAEGMGKRDTITSFFIHVADEAVLRARMLERGDAPEKADARIKACRDYEQEANESGVDYIRVDNSGDLTATVETILKRIDG